MALTDCATRAAGYKRNGRLAGAVAMTGCPETYFATDVTDAIGARALYPPYLHLPVTASVFWAITLRVQEFDKG
jgi:hypothetical protein